MGKTPSRLANYRNKLCKRLQLRGEADVASLTAAVAHSWQWRRTGLAVRGRLRVDPFSEAVACELENCAREQVRGEADVASMTTAVAHLWQWNGHGSSGASAADAASAGCAHHAPQQRPPLPPAEKVACGVREAHPDKAEEALEAMTTLNRQFPHPLAPAAAQCRRCSTAAPSPAPRNRRWCGSGFPT